MKPYQETYPRFKLTEAISFYENVLGDYERVLGPGHRSTLAAQFELACAYATVERLSEAISLFESTLSGYEKTLGPDHEDTVTVRHNLKLALKLVAR